MVTLHDERSLAAEAIAHLAHLKNNMIEFILRPAGVPREVYGPLLRERDPVTGRPLSKRQLAPLILEQLESRSDCVGVVRRILQITAG